MQNENHNLCGNLVDTAKEKLIRTLRELDNSDPEVSHGIADDALIEYINDETVSELFRKLKKWYS